MATPQPPPSALASGGGGGGGSSGGLAQAVAFYFVLKLVTSLDDLVWLSPFVAIAETSRVKSNVVLIYTLVCLLVSLEALGLAWATVHGVALWLASVKHHHDDDNDDAEDKNICKMLHVVGALGIAVLAFLEWRSDREADSDEEDDDDGEAVEASSVRTEECESDKLGCDNNKVYGSLETMTLLMEEGDLQRTVDNFDVGIDATARESSSTNEDVSAAIHIQPEENFDQAVVARHPNKRRRRRHVLVDLFVVGVCGTLDTLAVLFSVLVGQSSSPPSNIRRLVVPLLLGSMLAAMVILAFAYSITLFRPLTRCLQRVPLWTLLCAIAVYILVSGLLAK